MGVFSFLLLTEIFIVLQYYGGQQMKRVLVQQKNQDNDFIAFLVEDLEHKFIVLLKLNNEIIIHLPKQSHTYKILEEI